MNEMKYLSVCSGIEAATMAWHPLGWEPVAFSEIEKFPSQVLAHHYPDVPNWGDMTKFQEWPDADVDLLVGGTPCQSFSVAGLRKGLADPRGNLMLTYLAIARRYQPRWLVWENVPGVLSSNKGRDFAAFIRGLEECGYHAAWRVLDAQYVRVDGFARAVPQRRRRVFVVGYLGDWRRAAAVLFEREGMHGHPAPSRQAGKGIATDVVPSLTASGRGVERTGETRGQDPVIAVASTGDVAHCLNAGGMGRQDFETETMVATRDVAATLTRGAESQGKGGYAGRRQEDDDNLVAHSLRGEGFDASEDGTGRGTPIIPVDVAGTMKSCNQSGGWSNSADHAAAGYMLTVAIGAFKGGQGSGAGGIGFDEHVSPTLSAADSGSNRTPSLLQGWAVRRLTPTECERLQGFPDGFTDIKPNGKPTAEGPRYKALGNSMAVNVMRWIGHRIEHVEKLAPAISRRAA